MSNAQVIVGSIFYSEIGYDANIVSYYEVIAKAGAQSVVVREIAQEYKSGRDFGRGITTPIPGEYKGAAKTVRYDAQRKEIVIRSRQEYAQAWAGEKIAAY